MDNVGEVSISGFEAELGLRVPIDGGAEWMFHLAYAKQNGEVEELRPNVSQRLKDIAEGAKLIYTVPNQWKARVMYRQPLGNMDLIASMNYVYETGGYWDLNTANPNPMADQRRLNARIGVEADQWSFMVNGQNLTDEDFHTIHNSTVSWWRRINPSYVHATFKYHFGP